MKLLQCDFGALCTAFFVAATLTIAAPSKESFPSKVNTAFQKSANVISCSTADCPEDNRTKLVNVEKTQATTPQVFPGQFPKMFSELFSRNSSKQS